jgi:WD40 repeat protein
MTVEEAMTLLDQVLGQASLNDTQELVFRHAWDDWTYDRIAEQFGYATDHIKNVGAHLWELLSSQLGVRVTKKNLQAVLRRWAEQHASSPLPLPNPNRHRDWGDAPDSTYFTGRSDELALTEQWIVQDRCRIVALLGLGGIGKTTLAIKLAQQIQSQFDVVIWRSLHHAPALDEVLSDWIDIISQSQATSTTLSLDRDRRLLHLLDLLRQRRCLLILDNAESVLPCGLNQSGVSVDSSHQQYSELLGKLADVPHASCLLLTSREKPDSIAWKEGQTLPVRSLQLSGLTPTDTQTLFTCKGPFQATPANWLHLTQQYAGNPLALKMVAAAIQELFNSNVSDFLQNLGSLLFDDIRDLLAQQFQRLSAAEQEVMIWLAINRTVTSFTDLRDDLLSLTAKQTLPSTLRSLKHRFLIEATPTGFTQQPVVMDYVTRLLVDGICQELGEKYGRGGHALKSQSASVPMLASYALVKASLLDSLQVLQKQLILTPILNRLTIAMVSREEVMTQALSLLEDLRSQPLRSVGYAAGNILHVLRALKADFTGLDLSHLAIRQADFQGLALHQVKLDYSDLSRSRFNESFGNVWSVAFSPDQHMLALGDSTGAVHLWRTLDGQKHLSLQGHHKWVCAIAFLPDANPNEEMLQESDAECSPATNPILVSGSADGSVKLWNANTGQVVQTLIDAQDPQAHWIVALAVSRDGGCVASSGLESSDISLWHLAHPHQRQTLIGHRHWVCALAFSPTADLLASGSDDCTIKLWHWPTARCLATLTGHTHPIRALAFSPDGRTLASSGNDCALKLWQIPAMVDASVWAEAVPCQTIAQAHRGNVRSLVFEPSGQTLVSGGEDGLIKLWDVLTQQCVKTLHGHQAVVRSLATDSTHGWIASGGDDQTLRLWHSQTGQCLKILQGYACFILGVALASHRDSILLASSSADHTVILWDLATQQPRHTLLGHRNWVWSVAFSPDGEIVASASFDRTVKLWQTQTGQCLHTLQGHSHWVWAVAFDPSGKVLASSSSDGYIILWQVATGNRIGTIQAGANHVLSLAFHPTGDCLASSDDSGTIKLWHPTTGDCLQVLQAHPARIGAIAFSPDGAWLASGSSDRTLKLWSVATGECLHTFHGHTDAVESLTWLSRGEFMSGSSDRTLRRWDPQTGACLGVIAGHDGGIWSVAAIGSTDAAPLIASGSEDATVRLWNHTDDTSIVLASPRPYDGLSITGVTGFTPAQISTLVALGAIPQSH